MRPAFDDRLGVERTGRDEGPPRVGWRTPETM